MKKEYEEMKDNLMDIIKEEQAKLGYRKETIRLYYTLGSLNHLLKIKCDISGMKEILSDFCREVSEFFGNIEISNNGERFCFKIPDKGAEYVHDNLSDDEFICGLVRLVADHSCTIEKVKEYFLKFSDDIHYEKISNGEFDYLLYFNKGKPDKYYYCFTIDEFHVIYHRFLKHDYEDFGF